MSVKPDADSGPLLSELERKAADARTVLASMESTESERSQACGVLAQVARMLVHNSREKARRARMYALGNLQRSCGTYVFTPATEGTDLNACLFPTPEAALAARDELGLKAQVYPVDDLRRKGIDL